MKRKFVIVDKAAVSEEGHHKMYTSSVALAAHETGHDVTVLWNKRFPVASISAPYKMLATFSHTEWEANARGILPFHAGNFGSELHNALRQLELESEDIVLVHTCHFVDLVELLEFLTGFPGNQTLPNFHILLRYDPEDYLLRLGGLWPLSTIMAQSESGQRLLPLFAIIAESKQLRTKIQFHSDTQPLAEKYKKLIGLPFGVCPIPIAQSILLPLLGKAPERAVGKPLVVAYLGTPREEKGYHELLGAIEYLNSEYVTTGRVHFLIQCSAESLRNEPWLFKYQQRLEEYVKKRHLESQVRLIREHLDSEAYYSLLIQSDIILVGYSPMRYRYRSSGVLVEAMSAGKVIVTTRGSWMASCVTDDHAVSYSSGWALGRAIGKAAKLSYRAKIDDLASYSSGRHLGRAIRKAVDQFDKLEVGAKSRQTGAIVTSSSESVVAYLTNASAHASYSGIERSSPSIFIDRAKRIQSAFIHHRAWVSLLGPYLLRYIVGKSLSRLRQIGRHH